MTPADDGHVREQLGKLSGKLDMLISAVQRSEEKSDLSRASVHRRMDELTERMTLVETGMKDVKEDVKEMKPTVDKVTAWEHRGIGGLFIVGIGASAMALLLSQLFTHYISKMWP